MYPAQIRVCLWVRMHRPTQLPEVLAIMTDSSVRGGYIQPVRSRAAHLHTSAPVRSLCRLNLESIVIRDGLHWFLKN